MNVKLYLLALILVCGCFSGNEIINVDFVKMKGSLTVVRENNISMLTFKNKLKISELKYSKNYIKYIKYIDENNNVFIDDGKHYCNIDGDVSLIGDVRDIPREYIDISKDTMFYIKASNRELMGSYRNYTLFIKKKNALSQVDLKFKFVNSLSSSKEGIVLICGEFSNGKPGFVLIKDKELIKSQELYATHISGSNASDDNFCLKIWNEKVELMKIDFSGNLKDRFSIDGDLIGLWNTNRRYPVSGASLSG